MLINCDLKAEILTIFYFNFFTFVIDGLMSLKLIGLAY